MRRLLFVFLGVFLISPTLVTAQQDGDLSFDSTVCDFGAVVRENTIHTHVFSFVNKGEDPLVVLGVQTSCSCLKTEYSRRPLKQGERGEVTVHLEALKIDEGVFHRVVKVQTNKGLYLLTIRGQSLSSNN